MGEKLEAIVPVVLCVAVACIPILVLTGHAPHWFWVLF
jgi:hypothetical protein